MSREEKLSLFSKWVSNLWKKREPQLSVLKIAPGQSQPRVEPSHDRDPDLARADPQQISGLDSSIVGRYLRFTNPKTNHSFIGHPLRPIMLCCRVTGE